MSDCPEGALSSPDTGEFQALLHSARALIFDCDGTLVKTPDLYGKGWRKAFRNAGLDMELAWYHLRAGMSEHMLMDAYEQEHNVKLDRERTVQDLRTALLQDMPSVREIREIASVARRFHGLKPMAVASGGPREIVRASLDAAGLLQLFDTVVTIDDVNNAKPAPDLFLEAAERLGVATRFCLVLEDSPQGLQAAGNAGMSVIDVNGLI